MKRLLVVTGIVMALLVLSKPRVIAITGRAQLNLTIPPAVVYNSDSSTLQSMVRAESASIGVNPAYAACIVSHESQWTVRPGDDGNSRGLWQISRRWHPEVSDAVANSPVSSTIWSLDWIKAGHAKQWSTYWLYCSSTPIF